MFANQLGEFLFLVRARPGTKFRRRKGRAIGQSLARRGYRNCNALAKFISLLLRNFLTEDRFVTIELPIFTACRGYIKENAMKTVIDEQHRGFLFKKGKFIKMLEAGTYRTCCGKEIRLTAIDNEPISVFPAVDPNVFESDESFKTQTVMTEAKSGELTIHLVNGVFESVLTPGKYYFWKTDREHTFLRVDLSQSEFPENFPKFLFSLQTLSPYILKAEISSKQIGLLYVDNKYVRTLESGTYYFVKGYVKTNVVLCDTCLKSMDIVGQEILTSDKVTIRLNCVVDYSVIDFIKARSSVEDYVTRLYTLAQLAIRDYVGGKTLDEIIVSKNDMSKYLLERLSEKAKEFFIDIKEAAVKDVILPGEVRDIMNTVLIAEKRAQANVITRREEVASTRSLLNTARLMEENATLYKLKELEYIERICEKVGNINISGGDMLAQLTSVLCGKKEQ